MRGTKRNRSGRATKAQRRRTRKRSIQKAGFYPSVMAGVQNVTLLTPVALRLGLSMWDRDRAGGVRKRTKKFKGTRRRKRV